MALTADNFWLHFLRFEILLRLRFCLKSLKMIWHLQDNPWLLSFVIFIFTTTIIKWHLRFLYIFFWWRLMWSDFILIFRNWIKPGFIHLFVDHTIDSVQLERMAMLPPRPGGMKYRKTRPHFYFQIRCLFFYVS